MRLPPALLALFAAAPALAAPEAHRARGDAWRALDEFRAALAEYEAGLRLAPGDVTLQAERALTLHRLGEGAAARAALDAAVAAAGPGEGAAHAARAGLALLAGEEAAARADLAEALRRAPAHPRALALAALLAARRGEGPPLDPRAMEALRHAFGPWLE
ncbi:MAG: hypothetical protein N3D18_06185 [Roseococcus sp.]|nr:hypothetical protein [Roseococcus sp.]